MVAAAATVRAVRFMQELHVVRGTSPARLGSPARSTRGSLVTHPRTPSRSVAKRNVGAEGGRGTRVPALSEGLNWRLSREQGAWVARLEFFPFPVTEGPFPVFEERAQRFSK